MANIYGYGPNQNIINQLIRQKENIDNMINQYSQPQQPPVQNIINTSTGADFEARILKEGETPENTFIHRRTMFLDKRNKKLSIKEVDGTISESYEIVIPMDEKDKKILELERQLQEVNSRDTDTSEVDSLKTEIEQLNKTIEKLKEQPKAKKN